MDLFDAGQPGPEVGSQHTTQPGCHGRPHHERPLAGPGKGVEAQERPSLVGVLREAHHVASVLQCHLGGPVSWARRGEHGDVRFRQVGDQTGSDPEAGVALAEFGDGTGDAAGIAMDDHEGGKAVGSQKLAGHP